MSNPYKNLDDFCFWSRAMTWPPPGRIDPVTRSAEIRPDTKVSTMGSCFAQHLAKHIKSSGLNYHVTENAPSGMTTEQAQERNYGVFSARYGNVYTVRQAVQLFDRAFGSFMPKDDVWPRGERFVDAFRPQIEPEGFPSPDDVRAAASDHLACVRRVFTESEWLVFTLGLTEAWRSRMDGAIYPIAPGVAGGSFDPTLHEYVNFTAAEVQADLGLFITRIRHINPTLRILLTVSPVPLIATYEPRHVWVSTTFSKSALRVAADVAERSFDDVIYFPSYEIITSPAAGGSYYADDLRQVTETGVKHVMRVFDNHFFPQEGLFVKGGELVPHHQDTILRSDSGIVCDEEVIEVVSKQSGFKQTVHSSPAPSRPNNLSQTSIHAPHQTMPVTKEQIVSCYNIILGRAPESDHVINGYLNVADFQTLRSIFLNSAEFQEQAGYMNGSVQKLPFLALNLPANPIEFLATPFQLGQCIMRIKTVWSHLGIVKPHFSVLTHPDFLPENLGGNIDAFWTSGEGDATDIEKILERHGSGPITQKTCVEYGCGVGRVTSALVRRFSRVHAYDISEGHLAAAQQRLNDIGAANSQLHLCSDSPLDPLEKCDVFFSRIVFQHNPPPVIHHLVKTAFHSLNPGGFAIFQVPTYRTGYSFSIEKWQAAKLTLEMEMHCLPQHAIFSLANEEGCEVLEVREDGFTGFSNQYVSNSFVVRKRL